MKHDKVLRAAIIVPTYNGGTVWKACAGAIRQACTVMPQVSGVQVVDSSSIDDTVIVARASGFAVQMIDPRDFDHAGTRNRACDALDESTDIVIFLTQDAILAGSDSLTALIRAFDDPNVAVAYGRQLPHADANPIAAHARSFNYRERSYVSDRNSGHAMGLKAVFTSNSFAAYRLSVFKDLSGFPEKSILSEDMYFAAKAVMAGHKVAYVADATVMHSHNYTPLEEFRRYFDIGVFHHDEAWIAKEFGGAGGEGKRFLISEFRYLLARAPAWIPRACVHNFFKILGYKLGKSYTKLPLRLRSGFSMHRKYWDNRQ
ncbi:glycosyltransferase family 2 protein [Pollutimonas subterranea]|uniref:glycosyltransferase family 2 protein n=1 Tax=Pollutimonas subterranea TaxID=2045210 RepID=UPI001E316B22|nr:glycosyltransferase [Pollutimonas subterranea]